MRRLSGVQTGESSTGQPVVHFEIIGKDAKKPAELLLGPVRVGDQGPIGPMNYVVVPRDGNVNADGAGIGGGVGGGMDGYDGHVTFYVEVPDVEAGLAKAESLGGSRVMGPDEVPGGPVIAQFKDPEGHTVGLVQAA